MKGIFLYGKGHKHPKQTIEPVRNISLFRWKIPTKALDENNGDNREIQP